MVCQIVAAALLKLDQKLDREGIRLVLIGTSSPAQTKDYLDAWEMDRFPGQLVLDEKKSSHLVFGCKVSGGARRRWPPAGLTYPQPSPRNPPHPAEPDRSLQPCSDHPTAERISEFGGAHD